MKKTFIYFDILKYKTVTFHNIVYKKLALTIKFSYNLNNISSFFCSLNYTSILNRFKYSSNYQLKNKFWTIDET